MSTYLYLECRDHTPFLVSDEESGQHLYDLPTIREWIAKRDVLVAAYESDLFEGFYNNDIVGYFGRNTYRFLVQHKQCTLGIRDEYGIEHSVTEESE